ncbi:MAG: carbohydrate ABC transporter permease [Rhodospirillaceae bacterium]|nr:carbohydrate ABC transporter permease [Rhodospirillaceae bacterium]
MSAPAVYGRTPAAGKRRPRVAWIQVVGLIVVICACLFPFYWMVVSSLKEATDVMASPPLFWFTPTLDHYWEALDNHGVGSSLLNSIIVAASTTTLALALGTPAAYALARYEFKAKGELWFWFITNRMVSPIVLALPIFLLARELDLINSLLVLILVYLTFNLPIVVWICADQFKSVPVELAEAARLEGASEFTIFWRLYLPLGAPGVAVSAIFSFIFSWNELLYALVLTRSETHTAPVAATSFMSGYELPWGEIMATGTMIVLPVIIFAMIVSRQLVRGLTMGATK